MYIELIHQHTHTHTHSLSYDQLGQLDWQKKKPFMMMIRHSHARRVATVIARRHAARDSSNSASTSSSSSGGFSPRAIRVLPLRIISVSKGGGGGGGAAATDDLSAALVKRIQNYNRSVVEVKVRANPRGRSDPAAITRDESVAVLATLNATKGGGGGANEFVVALDERGKALDAFGFARLLAKAGDDGHSGVSFIIGGAYGHDESVRARATAVVSLSPLVLSHGIARVVLLEQLYRAYTQLAGHPYHHV